MILQSGRRLCNVDVGCCLLERERGWLYAVLLSFRNLWSWARAAGMFQSRAGSLDLLLIFVCLMRVMEGEKMGVRGEIKNRVARDYVILCSTEGNNRSSIHCGTVKKYR